MDANTEATYLRGVGKRLQALSPEQRDAVLDDVTIGASHALMHSPLSKPAQN